MSYVCQSRAGLVVKNPEEMVTTLNNWLGDGQQLLKQFAANSQRLGKPGAAYQIAETVWLCVQKKRPIKSKSIIHPIFPWTSVR